MVNSADRRSASKPETLNHRRRSPREEEREGARERVHASRSSLVVPMNKQIQISSEGARCVNHREACYTRTRMYNTYERSRNVICTPIDSRDVPRSEIKIIAHSCCVERHVLPLHH